MFSSLVRILLAGVKTAVIFLDIVNNQCTSVNVQATFEIAVG